MKNEEKADEIIDGIDTITFAEIEKRVEKALDSGKLDLSFPFDEVHHDDIRKALQNRRNELQKIWCLDIMGGDLPAVDLLFETGKIEELSINAGKNDEWPSFLEKCKTLTDLNLVFDGSELPSWIRGAASLLGLSIFNPDLVSLPDWIGELQSLAELTMLSMENLSVLPDSMANLKNLKRLVVCDSIIDKLPGWIGDLESLIVLSLHNNENLKALPDSIGNLKNLVTLALDGSPIEKLPNTIVNCTALKNVTIRDTKITSVPDFISSLDYFFDSTVIEVIPQGPSVSADDFLNANYKLAKTLIKFNEKAKRGGIISLDDELEYLADDFFKQGIKLLVDGKDAKDIRRTLTAKLKQEHNFYRQKLMEAAMEGILCIRQMRNEK